MGRCISAWLIFMGFLPTVCAQTPLQRFEFSQTEMAIPIRIVLFATDNATASSAAKAAFCRIHTLNDIFSDYDPKSELRQLCDNSREGSPVHVSDELWTVLVRSVELSALSDGAFDPTISPVVHFWRNARQTKELPKKSSIERALARVGYKFVRLHPEQHTVELLKPNMRLDLGGIAKGYAVDEAMAVLRQHGMERFLVDAGGNIGLGEPPPGQPGWRIGVAAQDPQSPPKEFLSLSNCALSTSGDMWQYTLIDGVRYSHLIDPRTGMALTDHCRVTVIGVDGLHTDGLSSAVAILGPERGLQLVETNKETAGFIMRQVDGKVETYESSRWKDLPRAANVAE